MAPVTDKAPLSDTESEKPVREQFQKATLAGVPADAHGAGLSGEESGGSTGPRGRLHRKRSFEEVEGEQAEQVSSETSGKHHTRKRSRDGAEEDVELSKGKRLSGEKAREAAVTAYDAGNTNGETMAVIDERPGTPDQAESKRTEATAEAITSPKTKRSRLHSTAIEADHTLVTETAVTESSAPVLEQDTVAEPSTNAAQTAEPLTETSAEPVPLTSGFANTAAMSPFGALAGSKSPIADRSQTSDGAFAASAFGSLAASSTSGFGAIGKSTGGFGAGGGFGSGGKSPLGGDVSKENEKPNETSSSGFGGALGQRSAFAAGPATSGGFGSGSTGFGKLGGSSGFGGALGGGGFGTLGGGSGGLSTFASGKLPAPLAGNSKASKAFGASAAADDDEPEGQEGDEDAAAAAADAGFKNPLAQEEDKQDERFYAQHLETGEEEEETTYSCRAKVYNYITLEDGKKEWRERGLGILRLNVRRRRAAEDDDDDEPDGKGKGKTRARFLMRADGSHRVVLNTPVKKEISFGAATGGPPQGGYMLFMGTIEGKRTLELLQLKVKQQYALELYDKVAELQQEM
ncbi:hypothetical protein LTR36_004563 [Oleoguttula mirabilis]|uniref:RanBD1 domain-containing protein n=1 Tax=Oleoguttula mirabilis TaxID=1507867 RepID=A0AAV9JFU4_9PEZI|nr:hypothetical protein LTR36_004563 [Oleoguttula mirabilis]